MRLLKVNLGLPQTKEEKKNAIVDPTTYNEMGC